MTLMRQAPGKSIVKIRCAIWEEVEKGRTLGSSAVHVLVL